MKQRLLLALLVLFAAAGMVKAAVKITVPAESKATVTWTLKKGGTTPPTISNVTVTNETSATLDNAKGTSSAVYTLTGDECETLSFSGKVTSFTTESGDLSNLKELSFAANMGLSTLTLSESILSKLTKLTIKENLLSTVPPKEGEYGKDDPKQKYKIATYEISAQSPENLPLKMEQKQQTPANKPLDITLSMILGSDHAMAKETDFTLEGWQYKGSNGKYSSTSYTHTDASAPHRYYFFSGGSTTSPYQDGYEYMDGEFMCNVKIASTSQTFPGVVIKNIPVKVLAAEYTMEVPSISPRNAGTISVFDGNDSKFNKEELVSKGDEFILIPSAENGYSFSKFESTGLTISEVENSAQYKAVVNGKATPSLKVIFSAEGQPITIQTPTNGAIEVYDGTTSVKNGDKIATGKKIKIHAIPNDGYMLDKLQINGGTPITDADLKTEGNTKIHEYTVTGTEAIVITASFKQSTSSQLSFKWKDGAMSSIQLNGENGSSTDENGYKTKSYKVSFNTKPTIKIQTAKGSYLTSVIASNNVTVNYQVVEKESGDNGTTYLISDFVMPNIPVTLVFNTGERSEAKIIVDAKKEVSSTSRDASNTKYIYNGTLIYDGTEKSIPYITQPNNLTGVILEYKTGKETETYYRKTGFINAGDNYNVRFSRPADDVYSAATVSPASSPSETISKGEIVFQISPATPIITTEPTVTINEDGKYVISGGVVKYARGNQQIAIDSKKYVWVVMGETDPKATTTLTPDKDGNYGSEIVTVRLQLKDNVNKDYGEKNKDTNFKESVSLTVKAKGDIDNIKNVNLEIYSKLPEGTSLTMKNGTKPLGTKAIVPAGTVISFDMSAPGYETPQVAQVDVNGNFIKNSEGNDIKFDASAPITASGEKMIFTITYSTAPGKLKELALISAEDKKHEYTGKVQTFDTKVISVKDKETNEKITDAIDWSKATITYKEDATGQSTTAPIKAGTYTVTIVRPADKDYKAFTATGSMIVEQAVPTILTLPNNEKDKAALIGKGMQLSTAVLTGGVANVDGTFEWVNPKQVVNVDGEYEIKFVSKDPNYRDVVVDDTNGTYKAYVKVTDKAVLSLATDPNYTITAKGSDGKAYSSGMTVPVGTTLTFTVTPASTYKLKALYVNGKEISGNTYKTTAGPISVKAEVTQEFTIEVTKPSKGAVVTLPSSNKVKNGESYSFTVACLAADKSKIVVKDGSTVISGTDGKYTISNITADKAISITLDNPTAITVASDTTLSPHKKPMGTVTITGTTDGKCYYGQTVTVKATPVSGVQFAGWTGTTETTATFSFKATQSSYKFKAKYTGSPTGIETIEGLRVYGSEGYVFVGCDTEATVTLIQMNGRIQKVEISGDTRIEAAAGVYGVIVEKGTEILKEKVIVR